MATTYGDKVVAEARKHVGVRETGFNSGAGFINDAQAFWGMHNQPWCAMAASKWYRDAGVDDQGLFSPSTAIMCSNARNNGIREIRSFTERVPAGAVIVRCGIHTEIVVEDRGNGILDCIGGNHNNMVAKTVRYRGDWRIFVPSKITEQIQIPTRVVYWFEDPSKMPDEYGGWRTFDAREEKLKGFIKKNPNLKGRIRRVRALKGKAPYKFQVLPPSGSIGGVSNDYFIKSERDKAALTYEKSHGVKVRRRSRKEIIPS